MKKQSDRKKKDLNQLVVMGKSSIQVAVENTITSMMTHISIAKDIKINLDNNSNSHI